MSVERKKQSGNMTNKVLLTVLILFAVLLVVLIIYFVGKMSGWWGGSSTNKVDNGETAYIPTFDTDAETTADSGLTLPDRETVTEETTTVLETETESLPTQSFGKWDLSTLDSTPVPYGNDPDTTNSYGIPDGVFWYTNKWGQYNVDFVSDLAVAYTNGETTDKEIYLTMDCGFDNEQTGPILDILKEKGVKATFFVTSMFYDARPDLIERMINEGHRIGSHTINHYDMTTLSLEEQETEIMDVVNKLKNDYNYDCRLFRFPQGTFSDQSLALVDNLGLKSVFWSYAYNDYSTEQPDVTESYEKAVKYLHPGAIYLLHASSSTNRAFLADWIDEARAEGYEFAGVYPVD